MLILSDKLEIGIQNGMSIEKQLLLAEKISKGITTNIEDFFIGFGFRRRFEIIMKSGYVQTGKGSSFRNCQV